MDSFFNLTNSSKIFIRQIKHFPDNSSNPTLIFLHDSWGCIEMWNDFPDQLAKLSGMNALLYDRIGHGKSSPFSIAARSNNYLHNEAAILFQILDAHNIKNIVIYGHSDGATIALIAAAMNPQRVKGLILEGAHSFIENSGRAAVRVTREKAKKTGLLNKLKEFHGDKTNELFRLWHETWLSNDFDNWSITSILPQINCPVLAFQGEHDEFGSIEQLNVIKEKIKSDVIIAEIPEAGHTPRKEQAANTMKLIQFFFNKFNNFL